MIYFYKHRSINELSPEEYNMLGYEGVCKFAEDLDINPDIIFKKIKGLESEISSITEPPFDMTTGKNLKLMNEWVDKYITFFNRNAKYEKQAYILIGNIASGKSTYARNIESTTSSIIIDPDRYKMGEDTEKGFFEGFTSLYEKPTDRERLQEPCSLANKQTLENVSDLGMNLIMPKAATSVEKLERQLQVLVNKNYDIHLILIETPITECANRNYYRYLIKEYKKINQSSLTDTGKGRFVPVSVITNIGDNSYTTFAKVCKNCGNIKYKSLKALYNDNTRSGSEELDIKTMA
jgi:predicted kinase